MTLLLEKAARQGLDRMPAKAADKMLDQLERIAADPFATHPNVKPLKGTRDTFQLRQGDSCAVYRIDRHEGEMRAVLADVRGSVYR